VSQGSAPGGRKPFIERFFENFDKVPDESPPIIPKPYRIPFFVTLSVLALIALVLVVWLVVVPGIASQQARTTPAASSTK